MTAPEISPKRRGCCTSQPTVSRELARFEKVLGLTLFERYTRALTSDGARAARLFEGNMRHGIIVSAAESLRGSVRANSLSPACRSFHNPFATVTAACSALSVNRLEYCAAGSRCWKVVKPLISAPRQG